MSHADVIFFKAGHDEAKPGEETHFSFRCPKWDRRCGNLLIAGTTDIPRDGQNKNGGTAQWDFNKNYATPTFSPSINCGGCWHGYIENGRCVDTGHKDEPEPQSKTNGEKEK